MIPSLSSLVSHPSSKWSKDEGACPSFAALMEDLIQGLKASDDWLGGETGSEQVWVANTEGVCLCD